MQLAHGLQGLECSFLALQLQSAISDKDPMAEVRFGLYNFV